MNCPACGAPVRTGAKFCPKCGTQLTGSANPSPAPGPAHAAPRPATVAGASRPTQGVSTGRIACAVAGAATAVFSLMPLVGVSAAVVGGSRLVNGLSGMLQGSGGYAFAESYSGWGLGELGRTIEAYNGPTVSVFFLGCTLAWAIGLLLVVAGAFLTATKGRSAALVSGELVLLAMCAFLWMLIGSVDELSLEAGAILLTLGAIVTIVMVIALRPGRERH